MPSLLRTALALIVLTPALAGLASCSDAEPSPSPTNNDTIVPSSALSLIQSFRFAPEASNLDAKREPGSLDVLRLGKPQAALGTPTVLLDAKPQGRRVIEASPGVKLTTTSTGFAITSPLLSRKLAAKQAKVTLPARLDAGFRVEDEGTKLGIDVKLVGATSSEGKIAETGLLVYENGFGQGRHIVHRPHAEGVEDYVVFEQRPKVEELRYEVHVPEKAGLRLVSNVLEVVDEGGAPRVRMTAPAVVEATGAQVVPTVQVEGCAVDLDARLPWGRPVTAPGAEVCSVVVGWRVDTYPSVVDPAWTTTGAMKTARRYHTATALAGGQVLVVGGEGQSNATLASSEVYDPATGTWTGGPSLKMVRTQHTATLLPSGNVLVAGGFGQDGSLKSAEVYDPATNAWTTSGLDMKTARGWHTATLLPSGKVLIAGGYGQSAPYYLASTEVYDPATSTWMNEDDLTKVRRYHTATALASGRVLAVGGLGIGNTRLTSSEVYDPATGKWTGGGSMKTARERHTATLLPSGNILVVGGDGESGSLASAEVYDPATGKWTSGPGMTTERFFHTATRLPSGKVLVAGGFGKSSYLVSSEVYDPASNTWAGGSDLATARSGHTATVLASGKVLIVGGSGQGNTTLASAEVYDPEILGGTCSQDGECASGYCSGGVCCDTPCPDLAGSCLAAKTGKPDGTCALLKQGIACTQGVQCDSGKCVDGVCCDTFCNGVCEACSQAETGQPDGTCAPNLANTDPHNECNSQGAGVCQTSGFCNGNGACADKSGTTCSATACINTTQKNSSTCDATGNCVLPVPATTDCTPYACKGTACLTACTDATDCVQGSACTNGQCQGPKANGQACGQADDCLSGFCVDGFCCNDKCTGQCEACDVSGKVGQCLPIPKGDVPHNAGPGGRQLCAGGTDPICHGVCDGASSTCMYPGPATTCDSSCQSDNATTSVCGGDGSCQQQTAKPCTPYACDAVASACKTSCETSADCSTGNVCNAVTKTCGPATSTCVDATHVKGTNGQVETCPAGYTCSSATGTCNTKCSSNAECDTASGYKCESSECKKDAGAAGAAGSGGAAGAAGGSTTAGAGTGGASTAGTGGGGGSTTAGDASAEVSDDDGGCGCEVPRSSRSTAWPGLAVAGLALASLRRRSRR